MDPRLLARLRDPACYPGLVDAVELRQTHLSVVCLAGEFAYKLKKPVKFPFVDFSELERRHQFCEEEVRLNRRLCPEIYLGVVPLRRTPEGSWTFRGEGEGEVAEWAVRMRRLPEDRLLHRLLARNEVSEAQIRDVARILVRFHATSNADRQVLAAGSAAKKREVILENFAALEECRALGFDEALHEAVRMRTLADLERWLPLLEERARRGRVVDGHGDLHARNICLTEPPAIFDCIEFRPEFRCGDVAFENAFLMMDLTYRGHPELAKAYLDHYIAGSGDEEQRLLMPLCLCYRAMVRAKVAALSGMDPDIPEAERKQARESVTRHLQLAAASALGADRILVMACGLPGTGKSHFCQALAERSGWPVIASDRVRKELAGVQPEQGLPGEFYGQAFSTRTYEEVVRRMCRSLAEGSCIVDANFPQAAMRARAAGAGRQAGGRPLLVWVEADELLVAERMAQREREPGSVSDADWGVYQARKESFEAPSAAEETPILRLDGGAEVDANVNRLLTRLLAGGGAGLDAR